MKIKYFDTTSNIDRKANYVCHNERLKIQSTYDTSPEHS